MTAVYSNKWRDPDPNSTGVLLSDRIKFYCDVVDMINPFYEKNLKPAAYIMHVGEVFYCDDKQIYPDEKKEIEIKPYGLIYFQLEEKLNLPYYMVARHNLKVKQQYRGLVVGVSLHVDPGYSGHLNYFVYNFTDSMKKIKVGDEIAVIEFIKTSSLGSSNFWASNTVNSEDELKKAKIEGIGGNECVLYENKKDRAIPDYWFGGETHGSALFWLNKNLNKTKKFIERVQVGALIAMIGLVAGVFGTLFSYYQSNQRHEQWVADRTSEVSKGVTQFSSETKQACKDVTEVKESLKTLSLNYEQLRKEVEELKKQPNKEAAVVGNMTTDSRGENTKGKN
jgi:deoxycytidine triphosphate deaminase/uncharacterized membrane-anchored protein YhcB (DUF1043 family)